ncbi:hypothetical protein J2741_001046 [Methanolinea mesophila]|uniref:hypothetical protein n=1 Tax=Methanolinea mesophila TaxID=547055 RepID=UPI001AEB9AAE|nr:hypothetical protein [Methanolinea mesophila]MBP1928499.1 hypothetical protein [Methanolinea mesophila]
MTPGEPAPRSVAERWAHGARALHNADRSYANLLAGILTRSGKPASPLPEDPLEEALLLLFSEVAKNIYPDQPETPDRRSGELA